MKGYKHTELGWIPENWHVKKLSNLSLLLTNGFVGKATDHYDESGNGVLYIQGYNVTEGGFNLKGIKRVTAKFHEKNKKSKLLEGDLLTIQTGDVGVTTMVPKHLEGSNCHALVITRLIKEIAAPGFYLQYLNSSYGRKILKTIETGSTMKHLNVGHMLHLLLPVPSISEQKAIAKILESWDRSINAIAALISEKQQLKKGLMLQLLTGKKRLPGFEEEWEILTIEDICEICYGKEQKNIIDQAGKYPIIGTSGQVGKTNSYLYDKPSVIIGRKGTIDNPLYVDVPFWTIDTAYYTIFESEVLPKWFFYWFQTLPIKIYNEASGVPSLSRETLYQIPCPNISIEEQRALALIFTDIDLEIGILGKQLSLYTNQKQGLMQQLLTGKKRVKV